MSRMSVTLDDQLIEEARELLQVSSLSEAIRIALSEAVRRRRLAKVLEHRGAIALDVDQAELARLRAEQ